MQVRVGLPNGLAAPIFNLFFNLSTRGLVMLTHSTSLRALDVIYFVVGDFFLQVILVVLS